MQIDISPEQRDLLDEVLRRDYQELRQEIHRTENFQFKLELHRKEKLLQLLLDKIGGRNLAERS